MRIIYEKLTNKKKVDGFTTPEYSIKEVAKKDATHKHICRHDEGLPCSREAL